MTKLRLPKTDIDPNKKPPVLQKPGIDPNKKPPKIATPEELAAFVIEEKWKALKGAPGSPKPFIGKGLPKVGNGFFRSFDFDNSRIYYTPTIGAFWVHGAIGERYNQLGGPTGPLGWPTSDELEFTEGGVVSTFENKAVYWWPDTGPIELGSIVVRYKGLFCFGETDEASASDEPYVILGVIPSLTGQTTTSRTQIYEGVDGGDSREDDIELYRGLPYALQLTSVLVEHDLQDPDKYKETIKIAVDKASEAIALGLKNIPSVGPFIAPVGEALLKATAPDIVEALNDLVGGKDDLIGTVIQIVTAKDMVRCTRLQRNNLKGILWHLDSPLISDGEASYKVFLDITAE